jgi:hypothetical protein
MARIIGPIETKANMAGATKIAFVSSKASKTKASGPESGSRTEPAESRLQPGLAAPLNYRITSRSLP